MNREAGYAVAATTVASPLTWPLGGDILVPVVPAIVGILAVLLVRIIVITKSHTGWQTYNIAVTLLCMLATGVMITDHHLGVGSSFWLGVGAGGVGVGIVEIGKTQFAAGARTIASELLKMITRAAPPPGDRP